MSPMSEMGPFASVRYARWRTAGERQRMKSVTEDSRTAIVTFRTDHFDRKVCGTVTIDVAVNHSPVCRVDKSQLASCAGEIVYEGGEILVAGQTSIRIDQAQIDLVAGKNSRGYEILDRVRPYPCDKLSKGSAYRCNRSGISIVETKSIRAETAPELIDTGAANQKVPAEAAGEGIISGATARADHHHVSASM